MSRRITEAAMAVARRPILLFGLTGLQLLLIRLALIPLSAALAPLLDDHPISVLTAGSRDALLAELLLDHPSLLPTLFGCALVAAALYLFVDFAAAGALVAVFVDEGPTVPRGAVALLTAVGRLLPQMLVLGSFGLLLRLVALVPAGVALWLVRPDQAESPLGLDLRLGLPLAGSALLFALVSVATDCARGAALRSPERPARRLIRAGLELTFRGGSGLFVALFSLGATLPIFALQLWQLRFGPRSPWLSLPLDWSLGAARLFVAVTVLAVAGRLGSTASDPRSE